MDIYKKNNEIYEKSERKITLEELQEIKKGIVDNIASLTKEKKDIEAKITAIKNL